MSRKLESIVVGIAVTLCFFWSQHGLRAQHQSSQSAITSFQDALIGKWTYRSFHNDPDSKKPANDILFGAGTLSITKIAAGKFDGRLDFGPKHQLRLNGWVTFGNPPTLRFQGVGDKDGSKDWVYDYRGYLVLDWANGKNQRPAIVGSIVRTKPHSGGKAPAGVVASWIAVRQDKSAGALSHMWKTRIVEVLKARTLLKSSWHKFYSSPLPKLKSNVGKKESALPAPERRSLALAATNSFQNPIELRSQDGKLDVTLRVVMAFNNIGDDLVHLRSYNGKLVGPTLRLRPGDKLRVKLINELPNAPVSGPHNSFHGFNVTNLHTHGLHVSPSGNSDNVLLEIKPGQTFDYEMDIPKNHSSGTFWYHAHKHGSVAAQVSSGMSGMLIIEGGLDSVKEIKAARERIFVLQQIAYYNNGLPYGVIEEQYVNEIFGPPSWDNLGRYTTINGIQLPVIRMQPGEIERWRLVHGGVRQTILLKIEEVNANANATKYLKMHEIALDGLALGKVVAHEQLELWPGYRSDVLVQAPTTTGEFLLVDERKLPADAVNGLAGNRRYLARLIVEGNAKAMTLPKDSALKNFRLPSIKANEVTGKQQAKYAIMKNPFGFTIDGKPYDGKPRVLKLGKVEEWKVWTDPDANNTFPVPHPFHIHVNPFEIFSMRDANNNETLSEPIWRDTIILRPGWTIRFRTRYEDFTGDFVQHCHILDHEDQGMMELVRIEP